MSFVVHRAPCSTGRLLVPYVLRARHAQHARPAQVVESPVVHRADSSLVYPSDPSDRSDRSDPSLVYTDASIARGRGGIGFAAYSAAEGWYAAYSATVCHPLSPRDINRLELLAVYVALSMLDARRDLVIHSDSQTALDQLTTPKRNRKYGGLTRMTTRLILARPGETLLSKVKGHSGDAGNDLADRLAGMATSGGTDLTWPRRVTS